MATTIPRAQIATPTAEASLEEAILRRPPRSFWRDSWERFKRDKLAITGAFIFLALCVIALAAPLVSEYVTGYDPNKLNLRDQYARPSPAHPFGADEYGRDYLTRTVWAGRISLSIGFLVAIIELTIGVILGLAAGYYGGWFDDLVQAMTNVINSIPVLVLLIMIGSMVRLDWPKLAVLLALFGWTGGTRLVRGQVLSVRQRDYVLAARAVGAGNGRIMFSHILPNVFSIVLVLLGFDIVGAMLVESALSFLGVGVQPPTATWGNMLSNALAYTTRDPWLVVFPGLAIAVTVFAIFSLADGLRDAMDPRLRR